MECSYLITDVLIYILDDTPLSPLDLCILSLEPLLDFVGKTQSVVLVEFPLFTFSIFWGGGGGSPQAYEAPSPGIRSDLSCSCDLSHSYGNAGSLTHCAGPVIELVYQSSSNAAGPIAPQWGLLSFGFNM